MFGPPFIAFGLQWVENVLEGPTCLSNLSMPLLLWFCVKPGHLTLVDPHGAIVKAQSHQEPKPVLLSDTRNSINRAFDMLSLIQLLVQPD